MTSRAAKFLALAALAALLAGAAAAVAQEAAAPSAEEILARAIAASGPPERLAAVRTRHLTGAMRIPAMGLSAPLQVWQARPNLTAMELESPELGRISSGCDGQTCWENSSLQGPRLLAGSELAKVLRDAEFDGLLNWRRFFTKAEAAGADTVDGRAAWKVVLTPTEGGPETWWFDAESGLPAKQSLTLDTPMGHVPVTSWLSDYRDVNGVKSPFLTRQSMMNGLQVIVLAMETLAENVELPADRFALPPEIAALKAKEAAAPPETAAPKEPGGVSPR